MDKFQFRREGIPTKMKIQGQPVERITINVKNKNASIKNANTFISKTMKQLFKQPQKEGYTKIFRVIYKLSNGKWYSTNPFDKNSNPTFFHPDLRDEEYNVNHSDELVEHININYVDIKTKEVNQITKYMK
jgi:hypothetical protein